MPFIRSISGLRATLDGNFSPETASKYAAAFSNYLPEGTVVVGRDGRPSGAWIEKAVCAALQACGRKVVVLGVVPTPTVQIAVERHQAAGGIAITASHNPDEWNGLKFLNSQGIFLSEKENIDFWHIVDSGVFEYSQSYQDLVNDNDIIDFHINSILSSSVFANGMIEKIKALKVYAAVDAVNASGSVAVPSILEKLGCKVFKLYCNGSGIFPHLPEPLPQNLIELSKKTAEIHADLGIAVDPDADRLVLIDETGTPIGEEKTVALAIWSVLMRSPKGASACVNLSTTRMTDDVAEWFGGKVFRSPVGEINVVGKMKECGAVIGGEGSGGVIYPESHYGRDCLVGTALILALMAETGKKLSELAAEIPHYSMIKTKFPFIGNFNDYSDKLSVEFEGAEICKDDGIKASFANSWIHARASNTEPIARIIAEAPSEEEAQKLIQRAAAIFI